MKLNKITHNRALACLVTSFLSVAAQSAHAALILQYDSISDSTDNNSRVGQLGTFNVDSSFVSSTLSFIGTDGTTEQGIGPSSEVNGGAANQSATVTVGSGDDVVFAINPSGGLNGTTTDSLNAGHFIFFTFTAAQAFDLTEISALSDPNNGGSNFGSRTAGAFVSVNGNTTFTQFGSDVAQNNNGLRTNTFTSSVPIASGDSVEVRLAFTNEVGGNGFTQGTRIGTISVEGIAVAPEPTSGVLLLSSFGLLLLRRRR